MMPRPRRNPLPIGEGGVEAELGYANRLPDPRLAEPMEVDEGSRRHEPLDEGDEYQLPPPSARPLSSYRGKRTGRVRVYHLTGPKKDQRCWAFTITRLAFDDLATGGRLRAQGATYPDGRAVVPDGCKPQDVHLHCGSCGTHAIDCVELEFYTV